MARRGLQDQRPREASSDASLWEDLDDPIDAFAGVSTPPLPSTGVHDSLPPGAMLNTASNPITISDSTIDSSSLRHGLEHELFPSGRSQDSSSSSTSHSRPAQPPSSFELDPARLIDPASQKDLKTTQYLRDEWLISAGQKEPDDWVENYIPVMRGNAPESAKVTTAKRGRSSLLDQIDAICSPSSSGSSIHTGRRATSAREPLRPSKSAKTNGKARATEDELDEMAAAEMLNMSCSPPSQDAPRIKLITDMPPEEQAFYRRLAFGDSSATSSPGMTGVTARGKNGKTWQTTWNDADPPNTSGDGQATTSRSNNAFGSSIGRSVGTVTATAAASRGSTRGRRPFAFTAGARKGGRGGKARSSSASGSSASRNRSRFFASRGARGGRRGRGR